jgi:hypothetical protein
VSGQSNVVADSISDTLTLVAGNNVTITTNAGSDSITINASGGGGNSITNGTSNVAINTSGGPVTVGVGGVSNVAIFGNNFLQATLFANPKTIDTVITLPANINSLLIGPITVANTGNIIVDATSTLVIL